MRKMYEESERRSSNVRGKAGKDLLDPERMVYIQRETLKWYPAHGSEVEKQKAGSFCILAIDEANRRLNRKNMYHTYTVYAKVTGSPYYSSENVNLYYVYGR